MADLHDDGRYRSEFIKQLYDKNLELCAKIEQLERENAKLKAENERWHLFEQEARGLLYSHGFYEGKHDWQCPKESDDH